MWENPAHWGISPRPSLFSKAFSAFTGLAAFMLPL